jgi:hypothetical protein
VNLSTGPISMVSVYLIQWIHSSTRFTSSDLVGSDAAKIAADTIWCHYLRPRGQRPPRSCWQG